MKLVAPAPNVENQEFADATAQGKLLLQVGKFGMGTEGSLSEKYLGNPTDVHVDPASNEAFIADGYWNRRVIVIDAKTGVYKRMWGAYGEPVEKTKAGYSVPYDPAAPLQRSFGSAVHCIEGSRDGLLYVCDRQNNRIQVFKKDGTFIKEASVAPQTMRGSVLDIAFSKDKDQTWMFVADGRNEKVWILRKSDMKVVGSFGSAGHFGGQFTIAHNIAIDSKNNVYVTESLTGQRIQRFLYKGLRPQL